MSPVLEQRTVTLASGHDQIVFSAGQGPALLWLHGIGGVDPQDPLLVGLSEQYTLIAPLAPGFSDLKELAEIDDVHDLAMHYDEVLDALELDAAAVAGHSFGAMTAAEFAAHYPKRVAQLVLVSPFGLWDDEYPVADLFAYVPKQMASLLYADQANARTAPTGANSEADIEALVAIAQSMTTMAKFMWPIPERGLSRRLRRIAAPTLVVFGTEDAFVPARYADQFASAIPHAEAKLIGGAGHMVHEERTGEVLAALEDFLAVSVPA